MEKLKEIIKNIDFNITYKISTIMLLLLIFIMLCKISYNTYRATDCLSAIDRSLSNIENTLYKFRY